MADPIEIIKKKKKANKKFSDILEAPKGTGKRIKKKGKSKKK